MTGPRSLGSLCEPRSLRSHPPSAGNSTTSLADTRVTRRRSRGLQNIWFAAKILQYPPGIGRGRLHTAARGALGRAPSDFYSGNSEMTAANKRWLSLVLWSVLFGTILFWLGREFQPPPADGTNVIGRAASYTLAVFGVAASIFFSLRFGIGFAKVSTGVGWRFYTVPPPLWLVLPMALATSLFWTAAFSSPVLWPEVAAATFLAGWFVGIAVLRVARHACGGLDRQHLSAALPPALKSPWPGAVEWIRSPERPINSVRQDMFGIDSAACRVAARLRELEDGRVPTINFVDLPGAGKTSFLNLVDHHLNSGTASPRICLREVSVWAAQTPDAMLEVIVDLICEELRDEVDTFWFRRTSREFVRALCAKESFTQSAFGWLFSPPRAPEMLEEISEIFVALGRRLVLVVEDLERKKTDLPQFAESLSGVLDLIRRTIGIGYIITAESAAGRESSSPNSELDLCRLCRIDDSLPTLSPRRCAEIIEEYRGFATAESIRRRVIDPVPTLERSKRWAAIRDVLSSLQLTPRGLKKSLANADNRLKTLFGEIDIDGTIVAAIYREAHPERWNAYLRASSAIRACDPHRIKGPTLTQTQVSVQLQFYDFPLLSENSAGPETEPSLGVWPQNIFSGGDTNYWVRFITGQCDGLLDQEVLNAIKQFDLGEVTQLLSDGRIRERICHFRHFAVRNGFLMKLLKHIHDQEMPLAESDGKFPSLPTAVAWLELAARQLRLGAGVSDSDTLVNFLDRMKIAWQISLDTAIALSQPSEFLNADYFGTPVVPAGTPPSPGGGTDFRDVAPFRKLFLENLARELQSTDRSGVIIRLFRKARPSALTIFSKLFSTPFRYFQTGTSKDQTVAERRQAWVANARRPVELPHVGSLLGELVSEACDSHPNLIFPQLFYAWCALSDAAATCRNQTGQASISGKDDVLHASHDEPVGLPGLAMGRVLRLFCETDPVGLIHGPADLERAEQVRWAARLMLGKPPVRADGAA